MQTTASLMARLGVLSTLIPRVIQTSDAEAKVPSVIDWVIYFLTVSEAGNSKMEGLASGQGLVLGYPVAEGQEKEIKGDLICLFKKDPLLL